MEVLSAIAGKIAELTVVPIGRQVGYLLFYKENFKELNDKMEELEAKKVRIKHDVEAERRSGRDIEDDVKRWQKRVKETLQEGKKLCEGEPRASVRCWKCSFPNLISRHQLGRKAKKMAFTIAELEQKKFDGGVGHVPASSVASLIFVTRGSEKLDSRNSAKEKVVLSLTDPKVSKVGIYGLGGVGKTTLAKEVAKHVNDHKLFDVVAMVTISQTWDINRVQDEIAYQLGFHLEEDIPIGRADLLCKRIKMEKSILIILDDLWEEIDLDKLGIPSEQDLKGCKLLLTSRSLDILQKNETQRNLALQTLDEVESWSLFEDIVGDAIRDDDLKKIASQVVERCVGLPVMIVSIAKSLKYKKNIYYWKDVLNNLKRVDNGDMYGTVFSAFEFTYNRLEGDAIKKVFLLCGVYGPSMSVSNLLKYVIGLGILKYTDTVEDSRNQLYRLIDGLKAFCLLLEDDSTERDVINMHDLVREVSVSIARKNEHVFVLKRNDDRMQDWQSKDFLNKCTQIILKPCFFRELPQKLDCPNLKFFLLHSGGIWTLKIPDSFFEGMGNLEVLELRGLLIPSLPKSLVSLTKLKTLCLDQCTLEHMTRICALIDLEILSFANSSTAEFSSEIGQLTRLRMLDLSYSRIEIMPPNILSKLTEIEELYMKNASIKWEEESATKQNKNASLAELGCLKSLTALEIQIREAWMLSRDMMFDKLERYEVVIGDNWGYQWSENERTSRLLKLKLDPGTHLEDGIKTLIERANDLYLDEVNGISDVLFNLNGEGFPLLKYLEIQDNGQVQHIINTMGRNETQVLFPKLETLILYNLNNLEKICHGPLPIDSFHKLTVIKIRSCDKLVYLCSFVMAKALSQLVQLQVFRCSSMKSIVHIENEDCGITADDKIDFHSLHSLSLCHLPLIHDFCSKTTTQNSLRTNVPTSLFNCVNIKVGFSSLETLQLSSMNVKKIWGDDHLSTANSIPNLAKLIVEDCISLKHLFSSFMIGSLSNLKYLRISKCEMMEEIIATEDKNSTASQDQVGFSKLERLVIKDMKSLKKVWHFEFERLKTLEVSNCGKLANIFPSDMRGTFGSLETLIVDDCISLKHLFSSFMIGSLSKLKHLEISKCEMMEEIIAAEGRNSTTSQDQVGFSKLESLVIKDMKSLKKVWHFEFERLKTLEVSNCGKLANIFPSDMWGTFGSLETLIVDDCISLKHLFSSFMIGSLSKLKHVEISKCEMMEEIIATEGRNSTTSQDQVGFSKLESLVIKDMKSLKKVWHFEFERLKTLEVSNCGKLANIFPSDMWGTFGSLETLEVSDCGSVVGIFELNEDETTIQVSQLKKLHLLSLPKLKEIWSRDAQANLCFHNLQLVFVQNCESLEYLFPFSIAMQAIQLEDITIKYARSMKQIVSEKEGPMDSPVKLEFNHLTSLVLWNLFELEGLFAGKHSVLCPLLRKLEIRQCGKLKLFKTHSASVQERVFYGTSGKLESLVVHKCDFLSDVLLPLHLVQALSNLKELQVSECDSLEAVFDLTSMDPKEVFVKETAIQLKSITLSSLPKLKHIWKQNLQETTEGHMQHHGPACSIQQVRLPNMETIIIEGMAELTTIWHPFFTSNCFDNLKMMQVAECEKLENIFPSYMQLAFASLETLKVSDCNSIQVIFEFISEMGSAEETTRLQELTLLRMLKLKQIWSRDPQAKLRFHNLNHVYVEECENLEYLFPFSIAMHEIQLKDITIKYARSMKQIVSQKEGPMDSPVKIEFNHLTSLVLWDLFELEGLFAGKHSVLCPLLKKLDIRGCVKLKLFKTQSTSGQERVFDSKLQISVPRPLFTLEEVICNLEMLTLNSEDASMILQGQFSGKHFSKLKILLLSHFEDDNATFPYWFLQNITTLNELLVEWSSFKEIFQDKGKFKIGTRIKTLTLHQLNDLQHICKEGFQVDPVLENLEFLYTCQCSKLKHFVPSSVTFSHLTYLEVGECNGLIHLITSSTARSLVKLRTMIIMKCNSLEQVVADEREGSEDEIAFSSLEILELQCLPTIERFCSCSCFLNLPLLEEVVVKECPRMKIFSGRGASTPKLQKISSKEDEEVYWEGDLTRTLDKMFEDKVAFRRFRYLELSKYPELKEPWYGQDGQKIFCNLKHLVVHKCTFLTNTIFTSNLLQLLYSLEELQVTECDSIEAVFDVKVFDDKEMPRKEASRLKKLTLSALPNLKYIWSIDLPRALSLENLQVVEVDECKSLKYVFSPSLCLDLRQLEELYIESCGVEEIVSIEEGLEELKFDFPRLTILNLLNLKQLTNFYPKRYTIECPSLKALNVRGCEELQIFAFDHLNSQPLGEGDIQLQTKQALFYIEKASFSSLETLQLSSMNVKKIWGDDHLSTANSIPNLAKLIVEDCISLKHLFSSLMIGSLSKLKYLEISKCEMMEEIIATEDKKSTASQDQVGFSKLESLVIKDMKSLKKVWHVEFERLKTLEVRNCGKLANTFPSNMRGTFGSLETLEISDCGSVEGIFELNEDETTTQVSQLKKLHLLGLPKLKEIWSRDAQAKLCFPNLQFVFVQNCESLEYLFPFSIAMQAIQLEDITIKYARSMKQIVSEKEGPVDSPVKLEFNHLTSLVLWDLFELEGLFAGKHSVLCPLLKKLDIRGCVKLKLFKTQSTSGQERVFDSKLQISVSRPLFTLEEVICNLEMLTLNSEDASMILQGQFSGKHFSKLKILLLSHFEDDNATFPYWFLQNITTLNELLVEWSSFKEIFQDKGKFKIGTRIKTLALHHLNDLQHICKEGFQVDPVLENLEFLYTCQCSKLKHLVPSSVTFSHLTHLEVGECNGLIHLITSSTARSLVKLRTMIIMKCNSLEQVVADEREGSEDEIAFSSLEILELQCLPTIERFCSCSCFLNLPLLEEVVVKECPRMKIFSGRGASTPKLQKISSKEDEEVYWEGDLTRTLDKMFEDKVAFRRFRYLELSKYPELKEPWYGQDGQKIFCNLKHLVVHKCTFLTNTIFTSNLLQLLYSLEELQVTECDSIEAVFDVKVFDDKEMPRKEASRLKKLTLSALPNLKYIWSIDLPRALSLENLQVVEVDECKSLKYVFSPSLCLDLRQLEELYIESCGVEEIVSIEEGLEELKFDFPRLTILNLLNLKQLTNFYPKRYTIECPSLKALNVRGCEELQIFAFDHLNSQPLGEGDIQLQTKQALFYIEKASFSSLETLQLSSMNVKKIWGDDHLSTANSIPNLAKLIVEDCISLKHLFSSLMIGSLSKLKYLEISKCEMMEEIIATEDKKSTASQDQVGFSKLESLVIKDMKSLKKVWHVEFERLKTLEVRNCGKLANTFPSDMRGTFGSLETLEISDCGSVEGIFELNEDETTTQVSQLKKLHLLGLPKLKEIWSRDAQAKLCFPNLQFVFVQNCESLEYLFPFSIVMQAIQLEDITIKYARSMKQIVSEKEGPVDSPVKLEFNHLTSLVLWNLFELEGLFAGNHSVLCPLLKKLDIRGCVKLKLFKTQSTSGQERVFDSKLQISVPRPLFTLEEVICNLEMLTLNSEDASMILQGQFSGKHFSKLKILLLAHFEDDNATFPYWFLQNITTLNELLVEWSSFKEIFQDKGKFKIGTRIKTLTLHHLNDLQHICKEGFQVDPVLENLEFLYTCQCSKLKHLVPSSVTFSHLTHLEVGECNGLIHLITSSTARSLVKLRKMIIMKCNSLEQVVADEREGSEDEIAFSSLEILELQCLPTIERFCSCSCFLNLPLLEEVVVKECPRMKIFSGRGASTPKLQKISSKEDEEVYWEGDLTRTLDKMFEDKVAFRRFRYLELSKYPELKEPWYGQDGQKIFCNLKHLVVHKCTFLTNTIFTSNLLQLLYSLEELQVTECDSIEAVFDVKVFDDKEMPRKEASRLKKLTLSALPNLKYIWSIDLPRALSLENLQVVEVDECKSLKYVFSPSLCLDLRQLEELYIESCGVEEIVSIEEGLEELKFDFPRLTILNLLNLKQLTNFYPKRYTIECPSLKALNVRGCEELQIFAFDHLNSQPLGEGDIQLQTKQALFYIEKVSQQLEELPLNENDAIRILKGKYEKILFQSIEMLRLQYFQETPMKFLNDLIQIFPVITELQVRCSFFKTLFPSEEIGCSSIESPTQIKTLWLFQLEQLEHIWSDDVSASHALVQNLESLMIRECSRIIRLAPPSVSFKNLTSLEVNDCNGLVYFMTSCTAKSLTHLTSLEVSNCGMLEEVVKTDEGESKEELTFESLKYLELTCLPVFKSFCYGEHTFIFPSLVTFKAIGCHKMQNFSYGVIIAPFLKLVEVENGKKHWKEDLNTTIKHLFIHKSIQEKESSSDITKSNQTHQMSASITGASNSEEQVGQTKPDQIEDIGNQETDKLPSQSYDREQDEETSSGIERPLTQVTQNASSPSTNQHTGLSVLEVNETIENALIQTAAEAQRPTGAHDIGSHESKTPPRENLFNQPKTFVTSEEKEITGTQGIHDTMDKPLIQADQDVEKLATTQNTEESHDSYIDTQKICDTMKKPSISTAQNVPDSTIIPEAAIDPSTSQPPEHMITSMQESNIHRNYMGMIDIPEQNMPYLEAGVKRHPQVLDWLNTEQLRVLASSSFSLFAEVTRILRTTRRGHLTENDRNNIRKCCTILEVVGFDASWLNYVYKCIEECGDGENVKRKVEEAKSQTSNLKAQLESIKKELASAEKSLELLLDKASGLDAFIES